MVTGTAEVRGQCYAWASDGHGEQDVLLVHGWQNAGVAWQPLVDRLDGSGLRVTTIDLPGCGYSPAPPSWQRATIAEMALDVLALVDELGLVRPVFVGHSLGGAIGLSAALAAPGALSALVLVAPASTSGLDFITDEQFEMLLHPTSEQRQALARAAFHRPIPAEQLALVVELVESAHPLHVEGGARSMREFLVQDRLARLDLPTLLVAGDRDRHVPLRNHLDTWRALPRCGLQVFHDTGHVPSWETPDAFADVVLGFIVAEAS
jgi:sigma-B regulation protein RsbQ